MEIIRDTRETTGWSFDDKCTIIDEALPCGDYALQDSISILIERKATASELATNLGKKWKQFQTEFDKAKIYENRYIVMEFSLDDMLSYPDNSDVPEHKKYRINKQGRKVKSIKMTGKFMAMRLQELRDKYDIIIIFAGSRREAERRSLELLKNAYQKRVSG